MTDLIDDPVLDQALAEFENEFGPSPANPGIDVLGVLESLCGQGLSANRQAAGPDLGWLIEYLDPATLAVEDKVELISAIGRQRDHLQALLVRTIADLAQSLAADSDDLETVQGILEAEMGWSAGKASHELGLALSLTEDLPATLNALNRGDISTEVAATISTNIPVTVTPQVRAEVEQQTLAYLDRALAHNVRKSRADVQRKVAREVLKRDPDGAQKRREAKLKTRDLGLQPDPDSVADLVLSNIPAEDAVQIYAHIDTMARAAKRGGDKRTMPELRADLTIDILKGEIHPTGCCPNCPGCPAATDSPDTPGTGAWQPRTRIVLTVPLPTLLGLADQPAVLGGFGPIVIEAAKRIIAHNLTNPNAQFQIAVTHPVTGALLQLHLIDPRLFRGRLRELIETLWPNCTWMTCTKPATTSEIDHIHPHAHGGRTTPDNGHPPCKQHHRRKTYEGWTTHKDPTTGSITWTSPHGQHYHVTPEPLTDPTEPPF